MATKKKKQKKKIEWSKLFCTAVAGGFGVFSIWSVTEYYTLMREAILANSTNMPDATIAVTCISVVISALLSYLLYQMGLKNSRNKYGVGPDGQPFRETMRDCEEGGENVG